LIRCGCLIALAVASVGMIVTVLLVISLANHPACGPCLHQVYPNPTPSVASPAAVAATAGVPAPGSLAEGRQFAGAQLARVLLPAGSHVVAAPPLVMQRPPLLGWQASQDFTSAGGTTWRLPLSMAGAVAYFQRNSPAGWRLTLIDPTGRMSGSVGNAVNTVLQYARGPAPPPGVWAAQVLLSLHPDGAAAAYFRADVQVGWFDARAPDEYIAGFGSMTVTGPSGATRTFSSPAEIATTARLLNELPAAPWDNWLEASTPQYHCAVSGAGYTVAFAVKRGGLPWTKVVLQPADPQVPQACFVDVSVWSTKTPGYYDFQSQPSLVDINGGLAPYLARLMG
jgi:hypothetical protein